MTDQQQALSQKKEPIVVGIVVVAQPGRPVQKLSMDASFSSALFMRICASRYLIG
jgi:energy-converting hydrogenase Eha subunit C